MSGSTTDTMTHTRAADAFHAPALAAFPTLPEEDRAAPGAAHLAAGTEHHPKAGETVSAPPAPRGPEADCTADTAGGLTFDVRVAEDETHDGDPGLLLRRRPGPSGETEEVRLPLAPVQEASPGMLRATLPSTVRLSEGRWNVFLMLSGQEPRRLMPGCNDTRSLVDRVPRESRSWLGVRIPYATKHGNLSVRSWLRWPHAEAGAVRVDDGGMELSGRLHGAEVTPTARLEARPRRGQDTPVTAEVTVPGDDPREFTAVLPYPPLAGHRLWDLWLRTSHDAEPVRIARLLDDVPDKKRIFTYPACAVDAEEAEGSEAAALTARPYYTLNNDLAVRIDRVEA